MFMMRFDMRSPEFGAPRPALYAAALEMAAWADTRGCATIVLSEHHASPDGYLPAPMPLAAAMAGRTSTVPINVAVVLLPLYDPIRLAEEMVVLDHISNGRVSYVAAVGYREVEYELHGKDFSRRGKVADDHLDLVLRAKTGEPFEHDGRTVQITPPPLTPGGPMVGWGGGSVAAARRAGRNGLPFIAQRAGDDLERAYLDAAAAAGREPSFYILPQADLPLSIFVDDDLDRAWSEVGPHLLHDARMYASWNEGDHATASLSFAQTVDELRAENRSHVVMTVDQAIEHVRAHGSLGLHPLVGGLPPDIAWPYLERVVDKVLPAVTGGTR